MAGVLSLRDVGAGAVAGAVAGSALLGVSWVLAATRDDVAAPEARAFVAMNGLPDALRPVVWTPVQVGSLAGSLVVVTMTAVITRRRRLSAAALLASQGAYWSAKVVKHVVARERPAQLLPAVHVRERATGLGYLSGHSAVAVALATVLTPALPRAWRAAPFTVAAVVGFGRMYAGVHLPLDVVGGVGLGLLAGIGARWALGIE